jgi:cyclomaltodextrin glucanotransferase
MQRGTWTSRMGGRTVEVGAGGTLAATVPAHGVEVYVLDAPVTNAELRDRLREASVRKNRL